MKITDFQIHAVEVDQKTRWVFLALHAGDEHCGLGEVLLTGPETVVHRALGRAAAALLGTDARQAAPPLERLADEQSTGLVEATVRSAVDQCLWDLRARIAGLPLHRMLGPTLRREFRLYANINRGTRTRSPQEFAARAAQACGEGFDAVKIAPFDGVSRATVHTAAGRAAMEQAVARVHAVRAAMGDGPMLMIDCHCRLDLASALRFLDATRELRIDWFEDVLPYHDLEGWSRLKASARAPLAGGETARGTRDLLPFLARGIWDVLMPDVRFFGGITELTALGALAAQHQLSIAPHNPRGPVATLASAHAMAGCPVFFMLEYQYGECPWRAQLMAGGERIEGGVLRLGDEPGLGASLDAQALAAHAFAIDG